jgi:hypothetical protein
MDGGWARTTILPASAEKYEHRALRAEMPALESRAKQNAQRPDSCEGRWLLPPLGELLPTDLCS